MMYNPYNWKIKKTNIMGDPSIIDEKIVCFIRINLILAQIKSTLIVIGILHLTT